MSQIIDGKTVALSIRQALKQKIEDISDKYNKKPGLAVVLVGNDPASCIYTSNKVKACNEVGIASYMYELPENSKEEDIESLIKKLNNDKNINGILVQLPLPKHLNEQKILSLIDVRKDVDGFSAYQTGLLGLGTPEFVSCTPSGIIELLNYYNIQIEGKNAVVIGRSNIVGKPIAQLLLQKNATVTICHSKTQNLSEFTKYADILVVAIGKANFVTGSMVKEGAVVIDVGINRIEGKLYGDVDFESVSKIASYITPVPGGVGPMTITMLLSNTVKAFINQNGRS